MKKVLLITLLVISPCKAHGMEERDLEVGSPIRPSNELRSLVSSGVYYPQMECNLNEGRQEQPIIRQEQPIIMAQPHMQPQPPLVMRVEYPRFADRETFYSIGLACFAMGFLWGINIGMNHCS